MSVAKKRRSRKRRSTIHNKSAIDDERGVRGLDESPNNHVAFFVNRDRTAACLRLRRKHGTGEVAQSLDLVWPATDRPPSGILGPRRSRLPSRQCRNGILPMTWTRKIAAMSVEIRSGELPADHQGEAPEQSDCGIRRKADSDPRQAGQQSDDCGQLVRAG